MKYAQSSKVVSDSIRDAAQAAYSRHWVNQAIPERKVGITPAFGKVKTWFVNDGVAVRSVPPPAPGSAEFNIAANELEDMLDNLTNDQRKIANF